MNNVACLTTCIMTLLVSACATAVSPPRQAYIEARPHGWLELQVHDVAVPAQPVDSAQSVESYKERAPHCRIRIMANSEWFLSESLYAMGEQAPYSIQSGFRLALPVGLTRLQVDYVNCNVNEQGLVDEHYQATLTMLEGHKTVVDFDGQQLQSLPPQKDTAVTLESLQQQLHRIEQQLEPSSP